jgi:hypothetical protein
MHNQEQHEMELEATHPSGAEEWFCPTCGRRFLMRWEPFERVIMEPGDEYAAHTGSKGGLLIGTPQVAQGEENTFEVSGADPVEDAETPLTDELRPWLKWMKDAGLDGERDQAA